MFSINFGHKGKSHVLTAGGHYAAPRAGGFRDTPAADLQSLVAEIHSGRPWREAVAARYMQDKNWLFRIITDASRTAFLDQVLPAGSGPVLDIGAGWGQVARPLAARRPVVALEPVAERMAFIQAAAAQDGAAANLACIEADYFEISFTTPFAVICAIGVLEWAGAFQAEADPQERQRAFLRKARRELAAGGSLILGIENRLGLKYLLGCPDDHLGVPHIGCLPAELARPRWREASGHALQSFTYSYAELQAMLREAGFTAIEFFGAFPDYKLPEQIVALADAGGPFNAWLAQAAIPNEHNGYDGTPVPAARQETLAARYRTLSAEGIAHHFAPSFFVRAG